jgi:hypothetical protein
MRNLVISLIFLGIAGYAAKILYEKFEHSNSGLMEKTYSYPDEIAIENQNGSEIQITLLGRNSNYLELANKDGKKFVYPIRSLSEQSQALIIKYPNNGIEDISAYLSSGSVEINDVYIIQLEDEIRKIKAEIKRLEDKANATRSQTELRTIERKIDELREEIAELENKIASRQ